MSELRPTLTKARRAWLATLKTGDLVAFVHHHGIVHIEPVSRGANGIWCGRTYLGKSGIQPTRWIREATEEEQAAHRRTAFRQVVVERLRRLAHDQGAGLSDAQLEQIALIIGIKKEAR